MSGNDYGRTVDEALADVVVDILHLEHNEIVSSKEIVDDWNRAFGDQCVLTAEPFRGSDFANSEDTSQERQSSCDSRGEFEPGQHDAAVFSADTSSRGVSMDGQAADGQSLDEDGKPGVTVIVKTGGYAEKYLVSKKKGKAGTVRYNPTLTADLLSPQPAKVSYVLEAGNAGMFNNGARICPTNKPEPGPPPAELEIVVQHSNSTPLSCKSSEQYVGSMSPPERSLHIKAELAKLKQETRKIQQHGQQLEERTLRLQQELLDMQMSGHSPTTRTGNNVMFHEDAENNGLQAKPSRSPGAEKPKTRVPLGPRAAICKGSQVRANLDQQGQRAFEPSNKQDRDVFPYNMGDQPGYFSALAPPALPAHEARGAQSARPAPSHPKTKRHIGPANPGIINADAQSPAGTYPEARRASKAQKPAAAPQQEFNTPNNAQHHTTHPAMSARPSNHRGPNPRGANANPMQRSLPNFAPANLGSPEFAYMNPMLAMTHGAAGQAPLAPIAAANAAGTGGRAARGAAQTGRRRNAPAAAAGDNLAGVVDPQVLAMMLSMQPMLIMANMQEMGMLQPARGSGHKGHAAASARRYKQNPPMLNPVSSVTNPYQYIQSMLQRAADVEQEQAAAMQERVQRVDQNIAKNNAKAQKVAYGPR